MSFLPLAATLACAPTDRGTRAQQQAPGAPEAGTSATGSAKEEALPPLGGMSWLEPLHHDAREIAKVSVPLGSREARPWMLGLHGGGDRAEWACGEWRGITGAFPFVVCPHGSPGGRGWEGPLATREQVDAAHEDLVRVFGARVVPSPPGARGELVVAGFSLGASTALGLVEQGRVSPAALVLCEGAYPRVGERDFGAMLARRGIRRLLLVCTTRGACTSTYLGAMDAIAKSGVEVRVNLAAEKEHGMYPEVTESIARDWPWLVAGLPGWERFSPPGDLRTFGGRTVLPRVR